ncbi:class I SAM-dependent methyltransferase [Streptomyces sp. NPDC056982]|uniref:class I SAM-dependent methyltransferase n=1 Tax=Streptomyces sp. NPDC056982 TaxID=3345986 RepID=UPI00363DDB3E
MSVAAREHWEQHFAAGDGFRGVNAAEMRMLTEHVAPVAGARVLDVGCGLGGYAAELVRLGCRTLATDWAVSSVAAVRDRYEGLLPGLSVQRMDFEDDEAVEVLPQAGFDVVTMRLVFAFMGDKEAAAARVRRLLAPGGVWVVTTPLADRLSKRRHIGITGEDVAGLLAGWGSGAWCDLEPGGLRCFVLRP